MWVPKWYWNAKDRQIEELERRVKRIELILLEDAQNKIDSLRDEDAGSCRKDGYLPIEEIINKKSTDKKCK